MSAPKPSSMSNSQTLIFTVVLCAVCAVVLAAMASGLKSAQERAIELDRNKQMLMAAHLLSHDGHFLAKDETGSWQQAQLGSNLKLKISKDAPRAEGEQIGQIFNSRIKPIFTDAAGEIFTPEEKKIDVSSFFAQNQKLGFANLPDKLLYVVLKEGSRDPKKDPVEGYIIPINGFGLWAPIYGYIAIAEDAKTVLGISWYQHGETPGLGANIAEASWQNQFYGKVIFQPDSSGHIDYQSSPIGIGVIKGRVKDVLGDSPRAQNSVDGMTGATLTGNGVTKAYKDVLEHYRPFLIQSSTRNHAKS